VTLLAQLTAGAFGTGWAYYAISLIVTLVLGIAANTQGVLRGVLGADRGGGHRQRRGKG
jgi:hypothetical protein